MRTLSLLFSLVLVIIGVYAVLFKNNPAGLVLMIIGGLAFLIIAPRTEKIKGYDRNNFMNK